MRASPIARPRISCIPCNMPLLSAPCPHPVPRPSPFPLFRHQPLGTWTPSLCNHILVRNNLRRNFCVAAANHILQLRMLKPLQHASISKGIWYVARVLRWQQHPQSRLPCNRDKKTLQHRQQDQDLATPYLFMLSFVCVRQQLSCLFCCTADTQQTNSQSSSLACHCVFSIQDAFHVFEKVIIICSECCQSQTKAGSMLDNLEKTVPRQFQTTEHYKCGIKSATFQELHDSNVSDKLLHMMEH